MMIEDFILKMNKLEKNRQQNKLKCYYNIEFLQTILYAYKL